MAEANQQNQKTEVAAIEEADGDDENLTETDRQEDGGEDVTVKLQDEDSDVTEAPSYLKIVITIRDNKTDIGMERDDTDPIFSVLHTSSITDIAGELEVLVEKAETRWEEQPRATAYHRPKPVQQRTKKKTTTESTSKRNSPAGPSAPAPAEKPVQSVEAPMLI